MQHICDPMDCSPLGFSVHWILQARILESVAIPFFRGSFWPRDETQISHKAGRFFTIWVTRDAPKIKLAAFILAVLFNSLHNASEVQYLSNIPIACVFMSYCCCNRPEHTEWFTTIQMSSNSSEGQKSKTSFTGLKSRCWRKPDLSGISKGESIS